MSGDDGERLAHVEVRTTGRAHPHVFPNGRREERCYSVVVERVYANGNVGSVHGGYVYQSSGRGRARGWVVLDDDGEVVISIAQSAHLGPERATALTLLEWRIKDEAGLPHITTDPRSTR